MQLSFRIQPAICPQTLATRLLAEKLDSVAICKEKIQLPNEAAARAWFSARVVAYFEICESGFITTDGIAITKGAGPDVPPFNESFSLLFKNWSSQKHLLFPKTGSEAPPIFFQVSQLFEPPLVCPPVGLMSENRSPCLSLIGRSIHCLPEETYPWKKAFKTFGLTDHLVDLLLFALRQRLVSSPRDVDLRFQIPLANESNHLNLPPDQAKQLRERKVSELANQIFNRFANQLPPPFPFIPSLATEREELTAGKYFLNRMSTPEQQLFLRTAFIEHKYFQAERLKTVMDADGTVRKMTKILHPNIKMSPPGQTKGPQVPLEVIITGDLKCPQLHHAGLQIPLNWDRPFHFAGKDVWTGLFCIALGNCIVVDQASVDEQAWCRLLLAYSQGQSCFKIGEESALVANLLERAVATVRGNRLPESVLLEEVCLKIASWFQFFYDKHEENQPISFISLYYNAVRTLNGVKLPLCMPTEAGSSQSLGGVLALALAQQEISFDLLDSLLQIIATLCVGLSPREDCPEISVDTTDGCYAIRVWMSQGEFKRSILLPLNLPKAFALIEKELANDPHPIIRLALQFMETLLSESRSASADTLPLLGQFGMNAQLLEPIVNLLIDREELDGVYLGLVFAELWQKFNPDLQAITRLIRRVPYLLQSSPSPQKILFLNSLKRLLNGTTFNLLIEGPPYPSDLLDSLPEAFIYWIKRLIQCEGSKASDDLKFLLADAALMDKRPELLSLAVQQDPALALYLLVRFRHQMADADLWKWVKEIVALLPENPGPDVISHLDGLAECFSQLEPHFTRDPTSTSSIIMMLRHLKTGKWEKLWDLLDQNKLLSTSELSEFSLELLSLEIDKNEVKIRQKTILKYLQNIEILRSLTDDSKQKLFSILKQVDVTCEKLEKMAQQCIQNDHLCKLGYILYNLVYSWSPHSAHSYLLVERLVILFAEASLQQREEMWNSLAKQCDTQFENFFSGPLPAELQSPTKAELHRVWPLLLMTSSDPQLVALGLKVWQSQPLGPEHTHKIISLLPTLAQTDFNAGLDAILVLLKSVTRKRLWEALLNLIQARPLASEPHLSQQSICTLIPLVSEFVEDGNLEAWLWLVNHVGDLSARLTFLQEMQRKRPKAKIFSSILDKTWFAMVQQSGSWDLLAQASKCHLSLSSLSSDQKEAAAIRLVEAAPFPMLIQHLDQLMAFLSKFKWMILIEKSQNIFETNLPSLLLQYPRLWQQIFPFLSDPSRLKLFPVIIEHASKTESQLASALGSFLCLSVAPELHNERFKRGLRLLLTLRKNFKSHTFSSLFEQCLNHCPGTLCKESENVISAAVPFFEETIPHLNNTKNFWLVWNLVPNRAEKLKNLQSALNNKIIHLADPQTCLTLATLCTELAPQHRTWVWQIVVNAIKLKMPFSGLPPEILKDFISIVVDIMPRPLDWQYFNDALTLLLLATLEAEKTVLNEALCTSLEGAISQNISPHSIHTSSRDGMPKLNPSSRRRVLPQLINLFIFERMPKFALYWWNEWLAIEWSQQDKTISVPLARALLQNLLENKNIDAAIHLALHPQIVNEVDSKVLIGLFESSSKACAQDLSRLSSLIKILFSRLDIYPLFIPQLLSHAAKLDEPKVQSYIAECHESYRPDLLVALCLKQLEQGNPAICLSLFAKYAEDPWALLAFKNLLSSLTPTVPVLTSAKLMFLPIAKDALSPKIMQACLISLLEAETFESLEMAVRLLERHKCLSPDVWFEVWVVLAKAKQKNLIIRAVPIFLALEECIWEPSSRNILEVWIGAIEAVRCTESTAIQLPLSLWIELDRKEAPPRLKETLCQDFFHLFLKYAKENRSVLAVREAFQVYQEVRMTSECFSDSLTDGIVAALIISSSFAMDITELYANTAQMATQIFTDYNKLPIEVQEELRLPYRTVLMAISFCIDLIPFDTAESITNIVRGWAGNGEYLALMHLLNRYGGPKSTLLASEIAMKWLSNSHMHDKWEQSACSQVLADLAGSRNLLKFEVSGLRKKIQGEVGTRNRLSLIRLLTRYETNAAANLAATLLLEGMRGNERLNKELCRQLADQLESLPLGELGADTYNQILLYPGADQLLGEDLRHKVATRFTREFIRASLSTNPSKSEHLIPWALEQLSDYLGHSAHSALTEAFIKFTLAVQDSRLITHAQVRLPNLPKEKCIVELHNVLGKIFNNARRLNKQTVSIFIENSLEISKTSDFTLALKIATLLMNRICATVIIRLECITIVRQFLLVLGKAPQCSIQPHMASLQPLAAKCISIYSVELAEKPEDRMPRLNEFLKIWTRLLNPQHNLILGAALFAEGDQDFNYLALQQACHHLNTIPSCLSFTRVFLIIHQNLKGIMLLDKPHAFLDPFITKLISIVSLTPDSVIEGETSSDSITYVMGELLISYADYSKKENGNFDRDACPIYWKFFSTLITKIAEHIDSLCQPEQLHNANLISVTQRLIDCAMLFKNFKKANWKPQIIPSFSSMVEQLLLSIVLVLPIMNILNDQHAFKNIVKNIITYLEPEEKKSVKLVILKKIYALMPSPQPKDIALIEDLLR